MITNKSLVVASSWFLLYLLTKFKSLLFFTDQQYTLKTILIIQFDGMEYLSFL